MRIRICRSGVFGMGSGEKVCYDGRENSAKRKAKRMEWAEIAVATTTAGAEAVAELLMRAGCAGTAIEDKLDLTAHDAQADWDYIEEAVYERYGDDVVVKGYLPADGRLMDQLAQVRADLEDLKKMAAEIEDYDVGRAELSLSTLQEEDWANEWRKYYKPIRVSRRIVVVPTWESYEEKPGDVIIRMEPGMAFGTGTHETTRMCLGFLDELVRPGDVCIDIGCGTAILGIAAAKLGAREVLAIDRDRVAVRSAKENITLNGVEGIVRAVEGDLLSGQEVIQADVIVVNIIADVIIGLVPGLAPFLKQGGVIIASGIIRERCGEVTAAMEQAGYEVTEVRTEGEWNAVTCRLA